MQQKGSLTSLGRGLKLLEAFQPGERVLGNAELAMRTGFPKSTVSRLSKILCEMKYLRSNPHSGGYSLGSAVLGLGYCCLTGMNVRERARNLMQDLANETSVSVALGIQRGTNIVYIEQARGSAALTIRLTVGDCLPIASTAIGRAYLAGCKTDEIAAFIADLSLLDPDAAAAIPQLVEEAREQIIKQGFYLSVDTWATGIHATAVPVLDLDTKTLMALNCGGAKTFLPHKKLLETAGPKLEHLAQQISAIPPRQLVVCQR